MAKNCLNGVPVAGSAGFAEELLSGAVVGRERGELVFRVQHVLHAPLRQSNLG